MHGSRYIPMARADEHFMLLKMRKREEHPHPLFLPRLMAKCAARTRDGNADTRTRSLVPFPFLALNVPPAQAAGLTNNDQWLRYFC